MRIPKIYLETTIFNFYFADDALEKRQDTLKLFEEISEGKYIPLTSVYVTDELDDASEEKRDKMYGLISKYNIEILPAGVEAQELSQRYVNEGIIPVKYKEDADHIAVAVVNGLDVIVSYNFKHIVKLKTKTMTGAVNRMLGYREIEIVSPTEVVEYDE
jgi:hypothetical protein